MQIVEIFSGNKKRKKKIRVIHNMNVYHVTWNKFHPYNYYSVAIVIAFNEQDARNIHPFHRDGLIEYREVEGNWCDESGKSVTEYVDCDNSWVSKCNRHELDVCLLGVAHMSQKRGIIVAIWNE